MMRILGLCDSVVRAERLARALGGTKRFHYEALICNNARRRPFAFVLRVLAVVVRSDPRRWLACLNLWWNGRLHCFSAPLEAESTLAWIRDHRFDVGLHSMGIIYRRPMIDAFRLGILNAHIGLLPRYRGRSVMEWSLVEGQATGVTVFFIDVGIDTGSPIVCRRRFDIGSHESLQSAKNELFDRDAEMYVEALELLCSEQFVPEPQSASAGRRYYVISKLMQQVAESAIGKSTNAA